jgi:AraC-like DNA-binding protein
MSDDATGSVDSSTNISRSHEVCRVSGTHTLHHSGPAPGHIARLAADLGFTDQSHLCRVVRSETDVAPSVLQRLLT